MVSKPKAHKLYFMYRGVLKCANCGCSLTSSLKKGKHKYYYCTNGRHDCDEHKSYLREKDITEEMTKVFNEVRIDKRLI